MRCFWDSISKESFKIILSSNKMASFTLISTTGNGKYGDGAAATVVNIAALNAFVAAVPKKTAKHSAMLQAAAETTLPASWDVRKNGTTSNGGKGIHPIVLNQQKCGSCWAHAIAGVASDYLALQSPNHPAEAVSVTSVMINAGEQGEDAGVNAPVDYFPRTFEGNTVNLGCGGGDPRLCAQALASMGSALTFDSCNDYSWYEATCGGASTIGSGGGGGVGGQTQSETAKMNGALTSFLTGGNGANTDQVWGSQACYYGGEKRKHSVITLDPDTLLLSRGAEPPLTTSNMKVATFPTAGGKPAYTDKQKQIMKHLHETGSVIGCFAVLTDFLPGKATADLKPVNLHPGGSSELAQNPHQSWKQGKNGQYVYIENGSISRYAGNHAVTIVGYNVTTVNGNLVPYWIVRNSWGEKWNDAGYFNMAMWPVNAYGQFTHEWRGYDPNCLYGSLVPSSALHGTSGIYVSFTIKGSPEAKSLPTLTGWKDNSSLAELTKTQQQGGKNCAKKLVTDEWKKYHQGDSEFLMKQAQTPNPPLKDSNKDNKDNKDIKDNKDKKSDTWQKIGKFFSDYWYIFLIVAVVIAIAVVVVSTNSKKRKPLF